MACLNKEIQWRPTQLLMCLSCKHLYNRLVLVNYMELALVEKETKPFNCLCRRRIGRGRVLIGGFVGNH